MNVRLETRILILFALIATPVLLKAQDTATDAELNALLGTAPAAPQEVPETPSINTAPGITPANNNVSSETVDVFPSEEDNSIKPLTNPTLPDSNDQENNAVVESDEKSDKTATSSDKKNNVSPQDITVPETSKDQPADNTGKNDPKKTFWPAQSDAQKSGTTGDDLDTLSEDLSDDDFTPADQVSEKIKKDDIKKDDVVLDVPKEPAIFDVGREERDLLGLAQNIQGQISNSEWNEVATASKNDSYTVVRDDWLFKISKRIFGSGFYYPKIWSLNSYITNPHFIEPGMVLTFSTGSSTTAPEVKLGSFSTDERNSAPGSIGNTNGNDLSNFGDEVKPKWIDEKAELENQGIYFQYASEETVDDLTQMGAEALNREYENYEPPRSELDTAIPLNYDKNGFDKTSKIHYSFREGFYLSTFISTNIVQDFGSIVNGPDENIYFTKLDHAYVKFDESINALAGDKFSVYSSGGKVKHKNSDREGYKYTIVAQIKLLRKNRDKWEIEFIEVSGTPQRGDRITAYTPKIERITKTYNQRLIEAAILGTYEHTQTLLGFGNVIYLDRGRADGVEMGNVFEVYGFKDRLTQKNISDQPTYKMGDVTVITLTDNFATALVTNSRRDFYAGDIVISKTKEAHLRELNAGKTKSSNEKAMMGGKSLEELDVELNLENLNDDLLKEADKIQLTEDELAELERQEREKSVIKDSERDLKALERLENEIEQAETILNDAKLDEDKLLENENLNDLEKKRGSVDQDSVEEIEENLGKRFVDEDLNSKDNPFGLTEFDVEEIDELLNVEKSTEKK